MVQESDPILVAYSHQNASTIICGNASRSLRKIYQYAVGFIRTMARSSPNTVELVGYYGSDETHALSAWTSTSRDLDDTKRARIPKLLAKLAKDGHHTPFEKSSLHFLVGTDIATHIQMLKHRIGVSLNAESARYKELLGDTFYIPQDWPLDEQTLLVQHCNEAVEKYHAALSRLQAAGVSRKRAKESARYYLPYANQLTADVMFNFRSFMHFAKLRYEESAQVEIYQLTDQMITLVHATGSFRYSLEAFGQ